jgi:hypothetical protein
MGISIKQLILNTKIKKKADAGGGEKDSKGKVDSSSISKVEKEEIIHECMQRVAEYIEYELKP